ncbi:MAG: MFS transporter [Alphaproteobacteria bacterium]|nr:MFS transporter [Alphaproteobacteria bacterium]
MAPPPFDRRAVAAWSLYNWASHSFPSVITTFVFATYFTQAVAPTPVLGTAWWGHAQAAAGLTIAVLSPMLGSVADLTGRRKLWLAAFTIIDVLAIAALWFVAPGPASVWLGLVGIAVATVAYEVATVFYNALLPELAPSAYVGRISGWGWGIGYVGGIVALAVVLWVFVQAPTPPFGLDKAAAEHVRAAAPFSALWYAVFALPLFVWVREPARARLPLTTAVGRGFSDLWATIVDLWTSDQRHILWFLAAQMIYTDGLTTLFAFGGIYAAGTFGMTMSEVIVFGIALNLTAAVGALAFAWVDDWIGPRRTIALALAAIIILSVAILLIESKPWFWAVALVLGMFFGPAQAASRSLIARVAPATHRTQMFGLFALSGRVTAFIGPAVLATATSAFDSQRAGMATIVAFFATGLALLILKVPRAAEHARS